MAHESPSLCEDTRRLDEEIQVSQLARQIVFETLPYGKDHQDAVAHHNAYYFPSDTPEHNQEMILLACTLLGEQQLPEDKRHALEQLTGELANRLRNIPRPAPDGSNAEKIQHDLDHAWELVYHWHHVLLGSHVAQPVPEKELYLPALEAFGKSGNVQRLPHVLGNPKTSRVLFPQLQEHIEAKKTQRELVLKNVAQEGSEEMREMMAYVLKEVERKPDTDLVDHDAPQKGELTDDHKLMIGFLIPMSTLLGPYIGMGVISALIADLKNQQPLFHSLHEFLVGMQALPEILADLPEEEQARILGRRRTIIGLLSMTLPLLGTALFVSQQH